MALKQVTVPVDGVPVTFSNEDWNAVTKPYGLKKSGWRQNDNLFNLLLGILGAASPGLQDASATSTVVIGTGAKTLVVTNGRPTPIGMPCYAFDAANANNFMWGRVTANAGVAGGNLTILVTLTGGAGTPASWIIQPSSEQGPLPNFATDAQTKTGTATTVALNPANLAAVLWGLTGKRTDVAVDTACVAFTRYRATSNKTMTLPVMAANEWVIVERDTTAGDVTVARNTQTIDAVASDFTMDVNKQAILFLCDAAGVVVTRLIGVVPT